MRGKALIPLRARGGLHRHSGTFRFSSTTTTNQMSDSKGENDLLKSSDFFVSASFNLGNIARRVQAPLQYRAAGV
jgi:hypothetical protein